MRKHLNFLLAAPIASFGGYAGHERRGSGLLPLRSAVLGLLGAALGIERKDRVGLERLKSFSIAVQSLQRSMPLRDFHTVQTVPTAKAKRPPTRRFALTVAARNLNTVITIRDYRCDVVVRTTVWGSGHWHLEELADSLRRPVFPLYLGRKACALSTPLNPVVCAAADPVEALRKIEVPEWLKSTATNRCKELKSPIYSDPVEGMQRPAIVERVPGEPIDRQAWTFGESMVWQFSDTDRNSRVSEDEK